MIVRILGEGQLEVPAAQQDELNELDIALAAAVAEVDEPAFERCLTQLLDRVHGTGVPVADDSFAVSDVILPGPGSSLSEVRELLAEEGVLQE